MEDNYSEIELATQDSQVMRDVKQQYMDVLNQSIEPFIKKKTIEVEED